jgi:hypothetical protein
VTTPKDTVEAARLELQYDDGSKGLGSFGSEVGGSLIVSAKVQGGNLKNLGQEIRVEVQNIKNEGKAVGFGGWLDSSDTYKSMKSKLGD